MTLPEIAAGEGGALLPLRVSPGAASARIAGVHGRALKVAVSAPPERGRANRAVEALVADALGVPAARVEVVRGESSRDKTVLVRGLSAAELSERVRAILVTLRRA